MSQQNLKICQRSNVRRFKQLKNGSNNEVTEKSTVFWLSVWKKLRLEKGTAREIENYEPTQLNTLLEQSNAEIKNKHG